MSGESTSEKTRAHWEGVYGRRALTEVSWYEPHPVKSLELIRETGVSREAPLLDVGGGASFLVDSLLSEGFSNLTVLDISALVLGRVRDRLGEQGARVTLVQADASEFQPDRRYALWHDRAVFHFLVAAEDRARYLETLRTALLPGGHVVMATFGPQGPERCSGLPVQRYDAKSLSETLGSDYQLVRSFLEDHRTPGGVLQQFLYTRYQRA